jgi:hypothetical protein
VTILVGLAQLKELTDSEQALLGLAHVRLNQTEKGLEILDKLSTHNPHPLIEYGRTLALHQLGRNPEAAAMLAKAKSSYEKSQSSLPTEEREELEHLRAEVEKTLAKN